MSEIRPFDFSQVSTRNRNIHDPELVLNWNRYTAKLSILARDLLVQVTKESPLGTTRADLLSLSQMGDSGDVLATPTLTRSNSTVPVHWVNCGTEATIDLQEFLAVQRFPVPPNSRAHVDVTRADSQEYGPALIFHFGHARFDPIEAKSTEDEAGER